MYMYPMQRIQYVNGIKSAEMYQMGPNQEVILMDSQDPVFYLKTTDAAGMASVREFEFKEKVHEDPAQAEIRSLNERIQRLEFLLKSKEEEYESDHGIKAAESTVTV